MTGQMAFILIVLGKILYLMPMMPNLCAEVMRRKSYFTGLKKSFISWKQFVFVDATARNRSIQHSSSWWQQMAN